MLPRPLSQVDESLTSPMPSSCYALELPSWRGRSMTYIWLRRPTNRLRFADHPSLSRLRAATRRLSGSDSVLRASAYIVTWLCHLRVSNFSSGSPEKLLLVKEWWKKELKLTKMLDFLCWHGLRYRIVHNHGTFWRSWRHYWELTSVRIYVWENSWIGSGDSRSVRLVL